MPKPWQPLIPDHSLFPNAGPVEEILTRPRRCALLGHHFSRRQARRRDGHWASEPIQRGDDELPTEWPYGVTMFHVTLRPWFAGSRVAYNTAEMMLTASTHLYTVAAENDQNVVPAKDDPLLETQCVYSLEAMSDRKSCNDQRTFEADLCDVFSCKGSRIPCGGKVEVEYPEGIALRAGAGVLSVKGSGEAFSRRCAAPQLLSSIKLHVTRADDEAHPNRGLLEIAWSQPVVFNKDEGWKTFTLCHSDTRGLHCPMRDPGMEIIIEHGAVKSVDDDEPNKRSVGHINGTEPCPTWDNEMTCSLVDGDRLRADEKLLDWRSLTVSKPQLHLQTDLDRMNVKYTEISWSKHKILRRLQSQSYLPRCLIIPGLTHRLRLMPELPQALFDYVHLGGQLYMLGSPVNIQLIEKANGSAQAAQRLRAGSVGFLLYGGMDGRRNDQGNPAPTLSAPGRCRRRGRSAIVVVVGQSVPSKKTGPWDQQQWEQVEVDPGSQLPPARTLHTALAISQDEVFVFGGIHSATPDRVLNDGWILDTGCYEWKHVGFKTQSEDVKSMRRNTGTRRISGMAQTARSAVSGLNFETLALAASKAGR
eukprot:g4089.t1